MAEIVIKAEGLGKRYTIGHQAERERYLALRDVLTQNARQLWRKTRDLARGRPIIQGDSQEDLWALKEVDFEIRRGEAVGIIGRNGAGKSTLLKVLSRITEPSSGRVTIKGRVASLLEVGTGFHPELSGRENIYLNGAILGMTRAEIKRKFDEIVAFAEVEKFLDTPVKRYSSGMYVRLAFAVAAHLEPEILVVDEVLAVGDAAFQKKCLGKMGDVAQEGRTVLFVSHNMAAIKRLCRHAIWLHDGQVCAAGATTEVVARYLAEGAVSFAQAFFTPRANVPIQYLSVVVKDSEGAITQYLPDDCAFSIEIEIGVYENISGIYFGMILQNSEGVNVLFADSRDVEDMVPSQFAPGRYRFLLTIPAILAPGHYYLTSMGIATINPIISLDFKESVCSFEIINNSNPQRATARPGIVNLHLPWETMKIADSYAVVM